MTHLRLLPVLMWIVISAGPASAQQTPSGTATPPEIRLKPVQIGDTAVNGFVLPAPASSTGYFLDAWDISGSQPVFLDRRTIDKIDPATGAFTVTLAIGPRQRIIAGRPGGAEAARIETPAFAVRPVLRRALYDGTRIIEGFVPSRTGVVAVRVTVMRSALESELGANAYEQVKSTDDFDDSNLFSVTLAAPLLAGQVVVAEALTAGQVAGPASNPVTVTDPGSWGRARAYFAGGIIFSKDREEFSQQDLAVTFAIDKSWIQIADFRLGADEASRTAARVSKAITAGDGDTAGDSTGGWKIRQLNTFFDGRLSALPVVASSAAGTGGAAGGSGAETFVASRKSAVMQLGIYAPIYGPQTSWVHEGSVNTFFLAPAFRVGIQTIVSDNGSGSTTNIDGQPDDVFNFWAAGFGFGHQRLSGTTDQTPEIISYMHVTFGKSEAFRFKEGTGDPAVIRNPMRILVEGRLKIPETPLQIGFDANLGERKDDIRFIFGTRFDIGEAFQRLNTFR